MSSRRLRPRRRLIPVIAFAALLAAVFLPGRSGLISVIARWRRIRAHQATIARYERQLDSLRHVRDWLADPTNASERARRLLGQPDTAGR